MIKNLPQLEAEFTLLSLDDQMYLVERLVRAMRQRTVQTLISETELARMAGDPDIQRELASVNAEFAVAELDGLDETL